MLIIDDSKFQRLAIQRALGHVGHEVITAGDGEEGLQAAREKLPEIIFLDMMLPKISGPDVLRAIRQDKATKQIPVFVLTALPERNRDRLTEDGASGYLEKSETLLQGNCEALLQAIAQVRTNNS